MPPRDPLDSGPFGSLPPESSLDAPDSARSGPRYTREGLLGKGGMGIVYLARDHQLDRTVALKEAAAGGDTAARLAREAQITAGLEHPGIVTVHDSGTTEDGRPFYTMRLLRGRPMSAALAQTSSLAERLALMRNYFDACNAIAYAHADGVIHRDLKPANIMVGGFGETQVVDWGLAIRVDATTEPEVTGTLAYMSPEQARGERAGFTCDVWSLGAILYELLQGKPPRRATTADEVLDLARTGYTEPFVANDAPLELVAIATKALQADATARYPNAGALASEVGAWLDGRPVQAHRYSQRELLLRLIRAWRAPIGVAVIATLVLLLGGAGWTISLSRERDRVIDAERQTRAALVASDQSLAHTLVAQARAAMDAGIPAVAAVLASRAVALADAPEAWGVLAGVALEPRPKRIGSWAVDACSRPHIVGTDDVLCTSVDGVFRVVSGKVVWRHSVEATALRRDGDRVFAVRRDQGVSELDLASGTPKGEWSHLGMSGGRFVPIQALTWGETLDDAMQYRIASRFCPGSALENVAADLTHDQYAVVCADGTVGSARIGEFPTRYLPTPASREGFAGVLGTAISTDLSLLVVGGSKGNFAAINLASGQIHGAVSGTRDAVVWIALSADGQRAAFVGDRGTVEVRTLPELALLASLPVVGVREARFQPDGTLLVAGGGSQSQWSLPAERVATVLTGPDGLTGATFSPNGRWLATAHGRFEGIVWALPSGARHATVDLGLGTAKGVAFTPDSAAAWFATTGDTAGSWRPIGIDVRLQTPRTVADEHLLMGVHGLPNFPTRRVSILNSGVLIAPGYEVGAVFAMDTATRERVAVQGCEGNMWHEAGQSPNGAFAVLVGDGGRVVQIDSGPTLRCKPGVIVSGAASADIDNAGRVVVAADHEIRAFTAEGVPVWQAPYPEGRILEVAVSGDGRWMAAGGTDHRARLWDGQGRLRAVLSGHRERVASVDFSADGSLLATGSWDGTARLWGLGVLDEDPAALDARAAAEWGLSLEEALENAGR